MSTTTKTITINSNDLGTDATLLLIFDTNSNGPSLKAYEDFYPCVLRVSSFGGTGHYATTLRYTNQLSFVKPEEGRDGEPPIVDRNDLDELRDQDGLRDSAPATWVEIDSSQKTTLTQDGMTYRFSTPTPMAQPQNVIQAWNESSVWENIVIAYRQKVDILPQSVWLFPRVGSGSDVTAQFAPILRAYIVNASTYMENQFVNSPIPGSPIWTQDLRVLDAATDWKLMWEASSGKFSIAHIF